MFCKYCQSNAVDKHELLNAIAVHSDIYESIPECVVSFKGPISSIMACFGEV